MSGEPHLDQTKDRGNRKEPDPDESRIKFEIWLKPERVDIRDGSKDVVGDDKADVQHGAGKKTKRKEKKQKRSPDDAIDDSEASLTSESRNRESLQELSRLSQETDTEFQTCPEKFSTSSLGTSGSSRKCLVSEVEVLGEEVVGGDDSSSRKRKNKNRREGRQFSNLPNDSGSAYMSAVEPDDNARPVEVEDLRCSCDPLDVETGNELECQERKKKKKKKQRRETSPELEAVEVEVDVVGESLPEPSFLEAEMLQKHKKKKKKKERSESVVECSTPVKDNSDQSVVSFSGNNRRLNEESLIVNVDESLSVDTEGRRSKKKKK